MIKLIYKAAMLSPSSSVVWIRGVQSIFLVSISKFVSDALLIKKLNYCSLMWTLQAIIEEERAEPSTDRHFATIMRGEVSE
jgi:hypothetical protein